MSILDTVIADMEAEVAAFKHGTSEQPKDGTREWFRLRGVVIGLAYMKRLRALGLADDPPAADRVYREASKVFKAAEEPLPS